MGSQWDTLSRVPGMLQTHVELGFKRQFVVGGRENPSTCERVTGWRGRSVRAPPTLARGSESWGRHKGPSYGLTDTCSVVFSIFCGPCNGLARVLFPFTDERN